jgi:predicted permease
MKLFSLLLALFPRHFRTTFGADMRDVFADQLAAARRQSRRSAVPALWIRTLARMPAAAWREHRDSSRHVPRAGALADFVRNDLRFTVRALARAPLFTTITVGVVAIGIGAVATIFSALNALVLRPLPGATEGHELFTFDRRTEDLSEGVSASVPFYRYLRASTQTIEDTAAWSRVSLSISVDGQNVGVSGGVVSANYFDVLGLRPVSGRFFINDDTSPSVVISDRLWSQLFSRSPDVVGRSIILNGRQYTVVGVTPEGFRGVFTPLRLDAWVPLSAQPHVRPGIRQEHTPWLWMFGRLRDAATPAQAAAELKARTGNWVTSPGADAFTRYTHIRLTPLTGLPDDARQAILGFGGVLMGAAVLVLLVAGANVSSLLAMRAEARRHEMALRTALGAGRGRLVRQLLTETLLLFFAGAAGGVGVAWMGTSALEQLQLPGDGSLMLELSPDIRVVAVAAALALAAGLVFGIGPGLRGTASNPSSALRSSTAGSGTRRGLMTRALIVGQLAGSLILLVTTALFVRALAHGATIDPGFSREHVSFAAFNTESFGYDDARSEAFYRRLHARVKAVQGVADLAYGQAGPLLAQTSGGAVTIERAGTSERFGVEETLVGTGYFGTLRIPLTEGRGFDDRDRLDARPVAVVSAAFARRAWPEVAQVVGRTFRRGDNTVTVVGVAGDVKFGDLDDPTLPFVYRPLSQHPSAIQTLFVRTAADAARINVDIVQAVRDIDPTLPMPAVLSLARESDLALMPQRVAALVTSILGGGALILACVGLYGVMAYAAAARTREVGVRLALGATRGDVVRLFVTDGARLIAVSLILGTAGAAAAAQLVSAYLLGGPAVDFMAFGIAAGVLLVVAGIATVAPARRASRLDPVSALRRS